MPESALKALEDRARHDLECLAYPTRGWSLPETHAGKPVLDSLIIGGGQSGIAIAFGLKREGIDNTLVVDRRPEGLEGPWISFARMITLRTPKHVTGPDLGIASLSPRAWYEARFGMEAWAKLGKIPRQHWAEYLQWLRRLTGVKLKSATEVVDVEPLPGPLFAVTLRDAGTGTTEKISTRSVVLATGIEGAGQWTILPQVAQALPRERYGHTSEAIDFDALKGKRILVLGAGASAFDNAATALEAGAARVDLLARRKTMPVVNPNRWMEFAGFMRHFADLDDAMKWRFMRHIFKLNQPPPQDTFERCARFAGFALHTGTPLDAIGMEGDEIVADTPSGQFRCDYLILGTGFHVDFATRPETARFAADIALWRDRYEAPAELEDRVLAGFPYLSDAFQLQEKVPGSNPHLSRLYCYTFAAMPSLAGSAGISAMKFGVPRLVQGVTRQLFLDQADGHLASLTAYDEPELVMPDKTAREVA